MLGACAQRCDNPVETDIGYIWNGDHFVVYPVYTCKPKKTTKKASLQV